MTQNDYDECKKINNLIVFLGILYSIIFIAINFLVVKIGFYPLLVYTLPTLSGSFLLLIAIIPPRAPKIDSRFLVQSKSIETVIARLLPSSIKESFVVSSSFATNALAFRNKKLFFIQIGYPLLRELTEIEMNSIIAHEIAHHLNDDTSTNNYVFNLENRILRIWKILERPLSKAILLPFQPFLIYLLKFTRKIQREMEFKADKFAASVFGKQSLINGLSKLLEIEANWTYFEVFWIGLLHETSIEIDIDDLYLLFISQKNQKYHSVNKKRSPGINPFNTHPTLEQRIMNLKDLSDSKSNIENTFHEINNPEIISIEYYKSKSEKVKISTSYETVVSELFVKYREALNSYNWKDLEKILFHFKDFSYRIYEIRGVEDYEFEKFLFIVLVSNIVRVRNNMKYRIGSFLSPVVSINNSEIDLGEIIFKLFENESESYISMLNQLGIDAEENVTLRLNKL